MSMPNEREIKNSEVRQESYTDINGNTHTNLTRTTETLNNSTNPNSYQNGYVQGRNSEFRYQQANLAERDEKNTSNGLLLGIIITSLAGLIIGGVWYFNQRGNTAVDSTVPVLVPLPSDSSPTPTASPQPQTRIIERTREVPVPVPVPVPQQQVTPPSAPSQPNINITVPPQQPPVEKAPSATQPTSNGTQGQAATPSTNTPTSQNDSSTSTVTPGTQSNTSKTTPSQGIDKSNTTSNSDSPNTGDSTTGGSAQ